MLATDIYTSEIPEIFDRFVAAIGDQHWRRRAQLCREEIKGNEFLREHLMRENEIAFQLDRFSELHLRFGRIPRSETENRGLYPAASFAAQVLSVLHNATKQYGEQLRRRIHGAFKNPEDIRGLRLEFAAATHFSRLGRKVSWPELTGTGTFDLLVEDDSHGPLEVECKSIGEDKGRKIRRRDVIDFLSLLKPHLGVTTKGLRQGLYVAITVPERLPSIYKERQAFAKDVGRAVFAGKDCELVNGASLRMSDFDIAALGHAPALTQREVRSRIDSITGTNNRSAIIIGTPSGGVLAFVIQSHLDDKYVSAVFDTLSDAAKRQLTGCRAGMLFVGLDGMDEEQLISIAEHDRDESREPTAIRIAASEFLSSPAREHVIGVGFMSQSVLRSAQAHLLDSGGTAYYFPKRESSFWSDGYSGMFNWDFPPPRT